MTAYARSSSRLALAALLISNGVLIVMALTMKWSYYAPLLIFWCESVIIGALNLVKMLITAMWGNPFGKWVAFESGVAAVLWTSILAFFFAVKFGGFVLGTGLFALILPAFFDPESGATAAIDAFRDQGPSIAIGAGALAVSHAISLALNFVGRREYERTKLLVLLFWPYARILWLYLVMIAGVIAVALMPFEERSLVFAVALVLIKLAGDVASHLVERQKFGIRGQAAPPVADRT